MSESPMWHQFFAIEGSCRSRPALEELDPRRVREKPPKNSLGLNCSRVPFQHFLIELHRYEADVVLVGLTPA